MNKINIYDWCYMVLGLIFAVAFIGLILTTSEKRTDNAMKVNWCYGEREVDGSPIISSRYQC